MRTIRHAGALLLTLATVAARGHAQDARDTLPHRRIVALPALGSAPETGLQYGATVMAVWQPAPQRHTRPSSLTATAMRTARQQSRVRLDVERWTTGNRRRVAGLLLWQEFPLPYYGIGDTAPKSAEEIFTPRGVEAQVTVQQRIHGAWYALGGVRLVDQTIRSDPTRALARSGLPGASGGRFTEWSLGGVHDTRDNLFAPRHGGLAQATYARAASGLLSDFTYGTLRLDARRYHAVRGAHVLAAHAQFTRVDGGAPFDQLALAGNSDILRGYARGRYRDRTLLAAQLEYRSPVRRRVGAAVFAGAGAVAPTLADLPDARLLPTYGAGLRVQLDARARSGIRADYGRGRDGAAGLYIGFNQAF